MILPLQAQFLMFFVYGLVFMGMGVLLIIESGRSPSLAEARVIRPLGVFGLLHGVHEWLEFFILLSQSVDIFIETWLLWLRVLLLALSFSALFIFSILAFRLPTRKFSLITYLGLGSQVIYIVVIILDISFSISNTFIPPLTLSETAIRYLLGVPGAALTTLALRYQSRQARADGRGQLSLYLIWAALGFGLYSLTQFVVAPVELYFGRLINSSVFFASTGVPIQVVRTVLAVVVTVSIFKATQVVEGERQEQLKAAQQEKLDALQQIQEELTRREAMRGELLRYTVRAQEDERTRIARELHDEMAQILTAFTLDLATLQHVVSKRSRAAALIKQLQHLSQQLSQSIISMVHDLRPAQLDDLGLVPALQYLLDREKKNFGVHVALNIEGSIRRIDPLVETVLFRVAQEALSNIMRHANTDRASIHLKFEMDFVSLEIIDSGIGFDTEQDFLPPRGWGLAGMQERAESVEGTYLLESEPGNGTRISVTIPLLRSEERKYAENSSYAG